MKRVYKLFLAFIFIISGNLMARDKIQNVYLYSLGETHYKLIVRFLETGQNKPQILLRDKMLQLEFAKASVWPKIEKKVSSTDDYRNLDTTILAYQFNKDTSRVRVIFPKSIEHLKGQLDLSQKDKQLEVKIPKNFVKTKQEFLSKSLKRAESVGLAREVTTGVPAKNLATVSGPKKTDEQYLENLLAAERKQNQPKPTVPIKTSTKAKSNHSFWEYGVKFTFFLGLICLFIFGLTKFFKKGMFKKGKINIFNSSEIITVLNTTYLGPKRSLSLVKVYDQVFLLGNSETGISLIGEIENQAGLMKEGEKEITGQNFDSNISSAEVVKKEMVLKKDINQSRPINDSSIGKQIKDRLKSISRMQ